MTKLIPVSNATSSEVQHFHTDSAALPTSLSMGLFSKLRSKPSERGPPLPPRQSDPDILTLDAAFKAHGKMYWGVATDQRFLTQDPYPKVIAADFGQVGVHIAAEPSYKP